MNPGRRDVQRISRQTVWLLPVIVPVAAVAAVTLAVAIWSLVASDPSAATIVGLLALLAAAVFAEAFPVPIEGIPIGATSLANVFIVGAAVLYGWEAGVIIGFLAMLLVESLVRRPPIARTLYNSALYIASAAAAGAVVEIVPGDGIGYLLTAAMLGSLAFWLANVGLLAGVIARLGRESFVDLIGKYIRWTAVPFAIMASVTLMLVALWDESPALAAPLIGPLAALALYERSVHRELEAMRLARTDSLTGLGNSRDFNARLEEELHAARGREGVFSVCVFDVDDFKSVNDRYGHAAGDRVLADLAARLRQDGEAFRLGGDEFVLILPDKDEEEAVEIACKVVERASTVETPGRERLSLSAGVASYPDHALDESELVRLADDALLRAKEEGKNRVGKHVAGSAQMGDLRRVADQTDRNARLRAAASLAEAVDERDAYMSRHSIAVGDLAARLAGRLALDPGTVELIRLAGRLHDLGKLAIPEEILRKRDPLTDEERALLQRHPQIGFRMLDPLGVDPVAGWVLHHHERWDGGGYPSGLAREDIPIGARIIFIADAFDAMTSDRVYRRGIRRERALAELERCAGTQFDPDLVAAFVVEVAGVPAIRVGV